MKPVEIKQNELFTNIIRQMSGIEFGTTSDPWEPFPTSMNGPAQPAMNPTETAIAGSSVVKVQRHPNDDITWNGPSGADDPTA